ncbi:MAG: ribosome maturation factor RimP [Myxococcales bacterium]|nr:ribosome maturation factor RimP [Myxococcales bacterium]
MANQEREERLTELAEAVCAAHRVDLVEVRWTRARQGWTIQVVIDRARTDGKDGSDITLDDCTGVSRDLSTALDVHEDLVPGQYNLEVSSPGLERPLVKLSDFERFVGREVKVRTYAPVAQGEGDKGKKVFQGVLAGVAEGAFVELEEAGVRVRVRHADIARAHLVHRF